MIRISLSNGMHELSICQALLEQIARVAADHQARGVRHIKVRNGPLSGVDTHFLEQAFTVARLGTVAEHAELFVESESIRVRCQACGQESTVVANALVCSTCRDWHTEILSGDALLLLSVELETD